MRYATLTAALLATSAVAGAAPTAEAEPVRAIAVMRNGAGAQVGTATLAEDEEGVRIAIVVKGLPPGRHGFNLHAVGRCDAPDFTTTGAHFNPGNKGHGKAGSPEAHAGDLPDLVADAEGTALVGFIVRGVGLGGGPTSLLGGAGTALVVSAAADPGGSKADVKRLACGVVTRR